MITALTCYIWGKTEMDKTKEATIWIFGISVLLSIVADIALIKFLYSL